MGQYYRPILTNAKGEQIVYNREVDGQYTMAKIMEHSWWENEFVSTITKMLYENPTKVVWVGDYADTGREVNNLTADDLVLFCDTAWGSNDKPDTAVGVTKDELFLDGLYLVNHTKGIALDCTKYRATCERNLWNDYYGCIHPLPLLTAIGNGQGGGDYHSGTCIKDVGAWANDVISVEKTIPDNYSLVEYKFIEEM